MCFFIIISSYIFLINFFINFFSLFCSFLSKFTRNLLFLFVFNLGIFPLNYFLSLILVQFIFLVKLYLFFFIFGSFFNICFIIFLSLKWIEKSTNWELLAGARKMTCSKVKTKRKSEREIKEIERQVILGLEGWKLLQNKISLIPYRLTKDKIANKKMDAFFANVSNKTPWKYIN